MPCCGNPDKDPLRLNEHGFALHIVKSTFQDALALRYSWPPLRTPTLCACVASLSMDHVLSFPKGGLPFLRHNEIRDLTATLLIEVCSSCVLQPIHNPDEFHLSTSNTREGAHLDIAMNGFWDSRSERCFIDIHVFNLLDPSNSSSSLSSTFKKHENIKHCAYGQRIHEVEHASFSYTYCHVGNRGVGSRGHSFLQASGFPPIS